MCLGVVLVGGVSACLQWGLQNMSLMLLPIAVLLASWLLGWQTAIILATAATMEVILVYGWHLQGGIPDHSPPLVLSAVRLIAGTGIATLVGIAISQTLERRIEALSDTLEQLKRANDRLSYSEERLRQALEGGGLDSWHLDLNRNEVVGSELFLGCHGSAGARYNAESFYDAIHPLDRQRVRESVSRAITTRTDHVEEYRVVWPDGSEHWLRCAGRPYFSPTGQALRIEGVLQEITEQKLARERIEYLAFHDALTGVPNRLLGQMRLQQAIATATRHGHGVGLLYLDLDKFKFVNDSHGHAVGDALLKEMAKRLGHCLRAEDTVCRLSGDEFMLIVPDVIEPHRISNLCERVLTVLSQPFELDGIRLFMSISIGVAIHPQAGSEGETLMRHADMALYDAKKSGAGQYRFFNQQMNTELQRYVRTRDALRQALERQEFVLHYQPQIELDSGRIIGVEALLRWQRPGLGLVQPADFIGIAEESGLIVPMGRWVLHQACRQAAAWQAAGWDDLVVAVNLSAVQFRSGQVEQDVGDALRASGLTPNRLELELTESMLLDKLDPVVGVLQRWKAQGIQLSIDDFGTGYSNLAYLKHFKVDKLKLDRSFISNMENDEQDQAIVKAMIQMARKLHLKTIAEGIEDRGLARTLQVMGCDEAQGYLFAKPMPIAELEQYLGRRPA
jgi:diguanylate cyclase (GGDEF)-like protein/PAS domain S-box-containing protein